MDYLTIVAETFSHVFTDKLYRFTCTQGHIIRSLPWFCFIKKSEISGKIIKRNSRFFYSLTTIDQAISEYCSKGCLRVTAY